MGNGVAVWLQAWNEKDWKNRDKEVWVEEYVFDVGEV